MNDLAPVFVLAIVTFGIYKIFELFVRRNERMSIIEKFSTGIDPQILMNQFSLPIYQSRDNGSWAIRIGLLLLGIGLGVVIAAIIDLLAVPPTSGGEVFYEFRNTISVLYPALAAVFGGLGLVSAYFIEKKKDKNNPKSEY
ncbi:MAG: DUF6249 domain-containing protein [Dysgonomonas sp.]|jgi:hypothetical protein|nr:hypothetical protein [Prevotella sp.]